MADVYQVVEQPERTDAVNVRGTFNLLEAARDEGVERFLYASTIWVYGNAPGPEPHDEDTPLVLPPHLYTATKLAGEMYCRSYETLYGLSTTILRFGIPYGPRARPAAVVPAFIAKAQAGTPLTIAGDGSATRQFVYVEDLAEGIVAALAPGRRRPRLQPGRATSSSACGRSPTPCGSSSRTCRSSTGPDRPADLEFGRASGERAAARARLAAAARASATASAATSTGSP